MYLKNKTPVDIRQHPTQQNYYLADTDANHVVAARLVTAYDRTRYTVEPLGCRDRTVRCEKDAIFAYPEEAQQALDEYHRNQDLEIQDIDDVKSLVKALYDMRRPTSAAVDRAIKAKVRDLLHINL